MITSWNPAAEAMFGYERDEVVGHHLSQFFPDDPVLEELLDAAPSGRTSPPRDTRWQTDDGSLVDVTISVSHLDVGDDAGYSVLVRDVRVRKAAETQLRRQARWQTAAAEIRLSLLSEASLGASLALVCKWAVDLSEASAAALITEEKGNRHLMVTSGDRSALGLLAKKLDRATELAHNRVTSLGAELVAAPVPISFPEGNGATAGALVIVGRREVGSEPAADEMLASLASQAILAFELANVRAERDRLLLSADRERIARDLHDLVIQRLFGAGLRLQGALSLIGNDVAATRVSSTIDDLDTTIKEIRDAIFALESAPGWMCTSRWMTRFACWWWTTGLAPGSPNG